VSAILANYRGSRVEVCWLNNEHVWQIRLLKSRRVLGTARQVTLFRGKVIPPSSKHPQRGLVVRGELFCVNSRAVLSSTYYDLYGSHHFRYDPESPDLVSTLRSPNAHGYPEGTDEVPEWEVGNPYAADSWIVLFCFPDGVVRVSDG
jgi:hypothetical protein